MLVCTLGDLLLDVIVRLEAPLASGDDATAQTALAAGGQAANVAAWAVSLGERGRIVAVRGGGDTAGLVERELARRGVEVCGPPVSEPASSSRSSSRTASGRWRPTAARPRLCARTISSRAGSL